MNRSIEARVRNLEDRIGVGQAEPVPVLVQGTQAYRDFMTLPKAKRHPDAIIVTVVDASRPRTAD